MSDWWKWTCPLCKQDVKEDIPIETVKLYIGGTHNCPKCDGLVLINEDLTCSDFGDLLVNTYKSAGCDVTKEQAVGNYVEVASSDDDASDA